MTTNYTEVFTGTQAVFRDDAAAAQASFEVTSRDNGGFHHTIVARDFTFAVHDDVRAGAERMEIEVGVESPASDADLARLKEAVDKNCPVLDTLQNPVPVELSLTRVPAAHPVAAE